MGIVTRDAKAGAGERHVKRRRARPKNGARLTVTSLGVNLLHGLQEGPYRIINKFIFKFTKQCLGAKDM